jgi:hypothetical protein
MANELQNFLAEGILKAAADLEAAFARVPEDKRTWAPADTSRSALDQMAECAILNGYTAQTVETQTWDAGGGFEAYFQAKAEAVEKGWAYIEPLFKANVERVSAAVKAFPTEALHNPIETTFGAMTMTQILSYPYWNMVYHEGQINYIASILGTLE